VSIAAGVKMKDLQVSMLLEDNFLIPVNLNYADGNAFFFSHFCIPVYHEQTDDMCCEWIVPYTKPLLMPIPNLSNLSEKNRRVVFWMNHTSHVSSFLNFMHTILNP